MSNESKYVLLIVLFTILTLVCIHVAAATLADDDDANVISYEELYERQKIEFVDALGYEEIKDRQEEENWTEKEEPSMKPKRSRRSTGDIYSDIAAASGGAIIHTDKSNLSSALDYMSSAFLTNPVIVSRKRVQVPSKLLVSFYVDNTIDNLSINIRTDCCIQPFSATPLGGTTEANKTTKFASDTQRIIEVSGINEPGVWVIPLADPHFKTYQIQIEAGSLIDFDASYVDVDGNDVPGQPLPGMNNTYVKVTPHGSDLVSNWTSLHLYDTNGRVQQTLPLGRPRGSRTIRLYLVQVTWPNMDLYLGVQGLDKGGNIFTRQQSTMVDPQGVRMSFKTPGLEMFNPCNDTIPIRFYVINRKLSTETLTIEAHIDSTYYRANVTKPTLEVPDHDHRSNDVILTRVTPVLTTVTIELMITATTTDGETQFISKNLFSSSSCYRSTTVKGTSVSKPSSSIQYITTVKPSNMMVTEASMATVTITTIPVLTLTLLVTLLNICV